MDRRCSISRTAMRHGVVLSDPPWVWYHLPAEIMVLVWWTRAPRGLRVLVYYICPRNTRASPFPRTLFRPFASLFASSRSDLLSFLFSGNPIRCRSPGPACAREPAGCARASRGSSGDLRSRFLADAN